MDVLRGRLQPAIFAMGRRGERRGAPPIGDESAGENLAS